MSAKEESARTSQGRELPLISAQLLERISLCVLLFLALVPRVRDIGASFDREFEGFQGAFFAMAAVNYERLGLEVAGGYPVLNIDLPGGTPEAARDLETSLFVYHNHPPTTALLAWGSLRLMAPAGWESAWQEGRAPEGIEAALRLPFLLMHLAALLCLWWLARIAFGKQVALIALALNVFLPVSALYGILVNYENASLVFILLAVAAYGCFVRHGSLRALFGMGAAFMAGCSVTFAPAFFLPPLILRSAFGRKWGEATRVAIVGGASCLLPILLHSSASKNALEALGQAPITIIERAWVLFLPLLDGSVPLTTWISAQLDHGQATLGTLLCVLASIGFLLGLLRRFSSKWNERLSAGEWPPSEEINVDLATPLTLGTLLFLFAFYRHTGEEQWSFWLYATPAATILAARAIHMGSLRLQKLRGGIAPLILVVGTVMLGGLTRFETWRKAVRAPGPSDQAEVSTGPDAPLPQSVGRELSMLLPAGSVGLHPSALGLNLASTWYAWRSLIAIDSLDDGIVDFVLKVVGLESAQRYLVLPKSPPAAAAAAVEEMRALLPAEPDLTSKDWEAWLR
ncbi:MAG: hypothetical protein ACI8X5_002276 [Planctomycetota bacterium]|jgi:hypothetical protein